MALVESKSLAITCSLETMNALLKIVDQNNSFRQYFYDRYNSGPTRRLNVSLALIVELVTKPGVLAFVSFILPSNF